MQKCVTVNSYSRFTDCRISKIARAPLRSIVSLLLTRPQAHRAPQGVRQVGIHSRCRFSGIASLPLSQMFRQSKANLQLSDPCDMPPRKQRLHCPAPVLIETHWSGCFLREGGPISSVTSRTLHLLLEVLPSKHFESRPTTAAPSMSDRRR